MSLPKWTPGRWIVEPASLDQRGQPHFHYILTEKTPSSYDQVIVASTWLDSTCPQAQANANLMAAAPDLYATLKAILDINSKSLISLVGVRQWLAGQDVLAKACGEATGA